MRKHLPSTSCVPIEWTEIERAQSLIKQVDEDVFLDGCAENLEWDFGNAVSQSHPNAETLRSICREWRFLQQDASNIKGIVAKLQWMQELVRENQMSEGMWMAFASTDIDMFHVQFRSLFDHLAAAKKRARIQDEKTNPYPDWFDRLMNVRNEVVHQGRWTLVFPDRVDILFQSYIGTDGIMLPNELMFNENVVDFRAYAALHVAYLFLTLEGDAKAIYTAFRIKPGRNSVRSLHGGLEVVKLWLSQLVERRFVNEATA